MKIITLILAVSPSLLQCFQLFVYPQTTDSVENEGQATLNYATAKIPINALSLAKLYSKVHKI